MVLKAWPCRALASKLRRGVTFGRKWTIIRNRVSDARIISKSHSKTLLNRYHKPSNSIQTISNTVHLIYA